MPGKEWSPAWMWELPSPAQGPPLHKLAYRHAAEQPHWGTGEVTAPSALWSAQHIHHNTGEAFSCCDTRLMQANLNWFGKQVSKECYIHITVHK